LTFVNEGERLTGQAYLNMIEESRLRPSLVTSAFGPAASKIFSSCSFAAPSFQSSFLARI
jgi:hypothetical protein